MVRVSEFEKAKKCSTTYMLALNETSNVLSGKWKLPILASLGFGKKRFGEMEREIPQINPRMLSKELRDLEANGVVTRKVYNTIPVSVEYELTSSGQSFKDVLDAMISWGLDHRKNAMGKKG